MENKKHTLKRYMTDIGKDSDDLIERLRVIPGNRRLTKKEIIYRSLEYSSINNLNMKESPKKMITKKDLEILENNILLKMEFFNKEIHEILAPLKKLTRSNK